MVQEIIATPSKLMAQPLSSSQLPKPTSQVGMGDIGTKYAPDSDATLDNQTHLPNSQGPVDNELYSRPYGQPQGLSDQKNSGLRDFMGGMIQDYQNMNLASSEPYGIAPDASHLLEGTSVGLEKKVPHQVRCLAVYKNYKLQSLISRLKVPFKMYGDCRLVSF